MINENEARILSDGFRIYNDDGSSDVYDIIPPSPSLNHRGGIIAGTKTEDDTVEIKIGEDGKGYVPTYPVIIDALSKTNVEEYTPTEDYHPATKQYVDDSIEAIPSDVFIFTITDNDYETGYDLVRKTNGGNNVTIGVSDVFEAYDSCKHLVVFFTTKRLHLASYSSNSLIFTDVDHADHSVISTYFSFYRNTGDIIKTTRSINGIITEEDKYSGLTTTSKTIIGAINELDIEIDKKQDKNFIVTITSTTDDEGTVMYTADKTITEIYEAYSNGKSVYLVYNNGIYNLTNITSSSALFFRHQNANYEFFTITSSKIIYNGDYLQKTSDSSLTTEDTSIVGAINEVNTHVTNAENRLEVLEQTQADWNQNDETALDYINNRVCYTKDPITVTILDEQELELTYDETYGDYSALNVATLSNENIKHLRKVDTLNVVWNDVEYEFQNRTKDGYIELGDINYENYPFYIWNEQIDILNISANNDNITKVQITYSYIEDVQLDEKYISYKPGLKTTGTVYSIDNVEYTARNGAEIFNDYENNIATGQYAHAEGYNTIASGDYSHSEGYNTIAFGAISHAEGYNTIAGNIKQDVQSRILIVRGNFSHAEGCDTIASGDGCHAEGEGTIASGTQQHVQGKYNIEDTESKYANIIGNGTSDSNRSNAHTVDWNGNAWYQGDVYVGGTGQDDTESVKKLATEEYVKEYLASIELITVDDIDTICGSSIVSANEVTF